MGSAFATCPIIAFYQSTTYTYTYSIYTKRKGPIHLQFYSPRKKSYFIPILLILRLCLLSPMLSKSRGFGVSLCPAPQRHRAPRRRHRARMGDAVVVLCAPTTLYYTTAFFQLLLMTVQVCSVFWLCCCCTDDPTECPAQTGIILVVVNFYLGSNQ